MARIRILFTFSGGSGHADPLVPIAAAARSTGHSVAFAGRPSVAVRLRQRGFSAFADPAGPASEPTTIAPLLEPSAEREDRVLRESYAGWMARGRATSLLATCAQWSPDVVVCDETDFGSMIAAERLGLPHATVLVTAAGSFVRAALVAEPLDALRGEHGLPPDPGLEMPSRHLVLSPFPPGYRDPDYPLPATGHALRWTEPTGDAPGWLSELGGAPVVYFTLGTVFNMESGDLFVRVLAGLRELPIEVVATVGHQLDPRALGPQPANVRIEPYVAQSALLPHCDLVVSHGGSGSVIGALAAGVPSVVLPMGADQPLNAARCEALGVGIALDPLGAGPEDVREGVVAVLGESGYRRRAERLQDEIAALPEPERAVSLIEALAPAT